MRHRLLARIAAPVAAVALALAVAPPASADVLVTGGTSVLTVPATTVSDLAAARITLAPADGASSVGGGEGDLGIAFTVTGGDADLAQLVGTIDLAGSLKVIRGKKSVTFKNLQIDLVNFQVTGVSNKRKVRFPIFDLADDSFDPSTGEFDSASAMLTPEAASVLRHGIGRTLLVAGFTLGGLNTTITSEVVVPPGVAVAGHLHAV